MSCLVAAGAGAGLGSQPQLSLMMSSAGRRSARGGRAGSAIRCSRREQARSPSSRIGWRIVVSGGASRALRLHVVEADHGDVSRDPYPGRLQLAHGPDRRLVVAADDRVRQFPARPGQDLAHCQLAADGSEPALEGPGHGRPRVLGYRLLERAAPFPRVRGLRRARDVEQPRPAVLLDYMADGRLRTRSGYRRR